MKPYTNYILIFLLLTLTGCSTKYITDGEAKYFSIHFLVRSNTNDVDARFNGNSLRVGSVDVHPDPNSIEATGGLVGEAGKVLLTP